MTLFGVDATSVSLLVLAGFASENEGIATTFVGLGLGGYAFGGPIVHLGHGQGERALGSFALRVGLPVPGILMAVGLASSCGPGEDAALCRVVAVGFGGLFVIGGALAAMIVDDTFLGKAPKSPKTASSRETGGFNLGFFPHFEPRTRSAGASSL